MNDLLHNLRLRLFGLGLLLAVLVGSVVPATAEPDNRSVHWLTYHEAIAAGRDHDKPILLHFAMVQSKICKDMKRDTYSDVNVIRYLNRNFAVAMINPDQLPSLASKYNVESQSVLWFLDSSGKALTSIDGAVGPKKMLRVTQYIHEKIYEHTDYNIWRDRRSTR